MSELTIRPRRRIEQRHPVTGALIGTFETTLSDEELAARDRQTAERREALLATNLSVMSAERQRQQTEREALAGIGADAQAREHLRAAHRALAGARDELVRRCEVAEAANRHVARCEAAAAVAREVLAGIAERAASALVAQLERGELPTVPTPTRAAAERAEAAKADLEHAIAARAEVAALAENAEAAVADAEMRTKEAARGVIRLRIRDLRAEIDGLTERLAERRCQLNRLLPTLTERRWGVKWPTEAASLLHDPEAQVGLPAEGSAAA